MGPNSRFVAKNAPNSLDLCFNKKQRSQIDLVALVTRGTEWKINENPKTMTKQKLQNLYELSGFCHGQILPQNRWNGKDIIKEFPGSLIGGRYNHPMAICI